MGIEPTARVGRSWVSGFALAWLGVWLAQLTVIQLLLPDQVAAARPREEWITTVVDFGVISAIAGVVSLVVFPLVGALSDRTTWRMGARRPWVGIGAIAFAGGLILLGAQHTFVGIAVCWSIALGGFSAIAAALTAMIADQVPVGQRGVVSAWISAPQAIGTILGIGLVTALALDGFPAYLLVAALLLVLVLPFVLRAPDAPRARPAAWAGLAGLVAELRTSPLVFPDFRWTLAGRVLVNVGNALGTTLLLYFLAFGLRDRAAEDDLLLLSVVYTVLLVIATLIAGRMSDRTGRRRVFVIAAAALQAAASLLLAIAPSLAVATVSAGLLGAGYGVFLSVDQALATQVLPDAASRGKDLGIMNVAQAAPQAIGPLLGAGIVAATGGFAGLFVVAGLLSIGGALAVTRVRSVR